jgi:F-type H+-transporting ATPase subunit epsilon
MKLTISQVDTVLFDGEAESVTIPASEGEMTVLAHHMPLVTTLKPGTIRVRHKEGEASFPVTAGVLDVSPSETVVLLSR